MTIWVTAIRGAIVASLMVSLLPACAAFEQPLDLEVRNESGEEVVVAIRGEGDGDEYVVQAGESRVVGGERPDGWSVWIGGREVTSYLEWPDDNPSIGLSIYVRPDGSIDVIDD